MSRKLFSFKYIALFYAFLIFAVSAIPQVPPTFFGLTFGDKVLHFIEYSIFSFLLFLTFFTSRKEFFKKNVFLLSSIIGIVYGFSDEIHQKFVPGRSCDILDFLADCLGIILIQIGIWLYLKRKGNQSWWGIP
jgi:VanZ family protein